MAVRKVTHPKYGSREVDESKVEGYLKVGWEAGAEVVPEAVDAGMKVVLDSVGDDPVKAHAALEAEQSRTAPRKSLVTALARIAEPDTKE